MNKIEIVKGSTGWVVYINMAEAHRFDYMSEVAHYLQYRVDNPSEFDD